MFEIISHRGNLNHLNERENHPDQIKMALKRFRVETDVWNIGGNWILGHDEPTYEVNFDFFSKDMILHCKNINAVSELYDAARLNWFWHQSDLLTLTSRGEIWCFPGNYVKNGITVLWEEPTLDIVKDLPGDIGGVCTDYPIKALQLVSAVE